MTKQKYLLRIEHGYFEEKIPEINTLSQKEKQSRIHNEIQKISEQLKLNTDKHLVIGKHIQAFEIDKNGKIKIELVPALNKSEKLERAKKFLEERAVNVEKASKEFTRQTGFKMIPYSELLPIVEMIIDETFYDFVDDWEKQKPETRNVKPEKSNS